MRSLERFIAKIVVVICVVWSVPTYANPSPGFCNPVLVNTRYESLQGDQGRIPTGSVYSGLIGKIYGSFNFTCQTHTSAPDGKTTLGVYFAGSGKSHISGGPAESTYQSNIEGIVLTLPPKGDISGYLSEGIGMISGKYAGESNTILLERYTYAAGFGTWKTFSRDYEIPLFYVYQTGPIPSSLSFARQELWLRDSVSFATYLHEAQPWSSRIIQAIQGSMVILYDQGCSKDIPERVEFDPIVHGVTVYRDFKIAMQCPDSIFTVAPDMKVRFDVVNSPYVNHSSYFPTFATYIKDGMQVNLQLYDQNNERIVYGRDIVYPSVGLGNYIEVPFRAEIAAVSGSEVGNFEFNIGVTFEYN
ncbi:hypothetical protein [Vibrio sp. SCSIO 43137]|uniref:hypothetical protein n=1 Tax=Vibrio sp. SCSIO 43137 TaxID=3021011 RepID=UPI002306F689|nr:hypothetical protein [Vibrio sp. SCSIO 43137]WCE31660.1 hypothetical protein PK654_21270 [Vibrio sp. SCSIO 43137]